MLTQTTTILAAAAFAFGVSSSEAFAVVPASSRTTTTTSLEMGLFDGVKEAFSAPALERSKLDSERETPIDRWMGWSVASDKDQAAAFGTLM